MRKNQLSISLVAFHNDLDELSLLIKSLEKISIPYQFFVVDNSIDQSLKPFFEKSGATYFYPGKNLGFGAGHNVAIRESIKQGYHFHLLVNPDVYFESDVVEKLIEFINSNEEFAMVGPEITWPDGKVQHNARRLPRPFDLFIRRFIPRTWVKSRLANYEMQDKDYGDSFEAGFVSDSFALYKTKALKDVGLYEEKFFLHMEEIDMGIRLKKIGYKVMYYPHVKVVHGRRSEHRTSWKVFKITLRAAILYYNKHGWLPIR